ncbi:hypothetical protein FB565_000181 [Actinoplanes lutulentus]|uniref:hypothetical protein n=1 Tax=Actinoplanes lutulentus TaxID=1287878 RepID=UPI0011B93DB8|nr:hypothetical protein [Actinoplanes lutulentus]MBB2940477.1 hypothetical protein [Actinoplanes lutulentus]
MIDPNAAILPTTRRPTVGHELAEPVSASPAGAGPSQENGSVTNLITEPFHHGGLFTAGDGLDPDAIAALRVLHTRCRQQAVALRRRIALRRAGRTRRWLRRDGRSARRRRSRCRPAHPPPGPPRRFGRPSPGPSTDGYCTSCGTRGSPTTP